MLLINKLNLNFSFDYDFPTTYQNTEKTAYRMFNFVSK